MCVQGNVKKKEGIISSKYLLSSCLADILTAVLNSTALIVGSHDHTDAFYCHGQASITSALVNYAVHVSAM